VDRLSARALYYASEFWISFAFAVSFTVTGVYFVREVGMNPLELVLVGTVMEASILVFEVPTGVVADTYSRRLSIIIGWIVLGVGLVVAGLVPSVAVVLLGYAIWGLGWTFQSGALQAWITDEVGVDRVGRIFARGDQIGYLGALVGIPLSVAVATRDLGLAVSLGGLLTAGFGVFALFAMPETAFVRRPAAERGNAWRELRTTAGAGSRFVRAQPLLLLILAIGLFAGASTESFDRLQEAQFIRNVGLPELGGLDPVVWFGVFAAGSLLLGLLATEVLVRRFERVGQEGLARLLFFMTVVQVCTVVVFALAGSLIVALAGMWCYRLTRSLIGPVYFTWLNQNITDSSIRATVTSITNQSDAVGQVAGGPALGAIGTVFGLRAALLAGGRCWCRRSACTDVRSGVAGGSPSCASSGEPAGVHDRVGRALADLQSAG